MSCIISTGFAQELEHKAPTLQVGLDGLSLGKGTLDAELIAQIIGEKQSEIKIKLIQNSFLQKLGASGGTVYNYADNVVKGIVQESSADIRTKKIVENTVNVVFVYAFANYYTQQATHSSALDGVKGEIGISSIYDYSNGLIGAKLGSTTASGGVRRSTGSENNYDPLKAEFLATVIDVASEVVRSNEKLRELGLFRISYSNTYEYMNYYKKNESNQKYKDLYSSMETFLNKFIPLIGGVSYAVNHSNVKGNSVGTIAPLYTGYNAVTTASTIDTDLTNAINKIETSIKKISTDYGKTLDHISENQGSYVFATIQELSSEVDYLKRVQLLLQKLPVASRADRDAILSDAMYTIESELKKDIRRSVALDPDLLDVQALLTDISANLYNELVNAHSFLSVLTNDPDPFIKLVSSLYEFDRTKTFSEYRNLLLLLDDLFVTGRIKTALSTINTFVKDYIVIGTDDNDREVINFNVESFLVRLESMQSSRIRRFQFLFTVGMNTSFFYDKHVFPLNDSTGVRNLSYFSEKIGVKFKIISRGDWWPRSPGETYGSFGKYYTKKSTPKEPIISNWHAIAYGSGLLYNAINSTTEKEFDFPLFGVGTGVTFYNALDLNCSISWPLMPGGIKEMRRYPMFNFGFDILFAEYLSELNKKRNNKKARKDIIKYTNAKVGL